MSLIEIEWKSWHCTEIDIDDIYAICKRMMRERKASITQVVDKAISEYISILDDEYYYSWNEDAQKQARKAVLEHFIGK